LKQKTTQNQESLPEGCIAHAIWDVTGQFVPPQKLIYIIQDCASWIKSRALLQIMLPAEFLAAVGSRR
jgi:hypothetical protein